MCDGFLRYLRSLCLNTNRKRSFGLHEGNRDESIPCPPG